MSRRHSRTKRTSELVLCDCGQPTRDDAFACGDCLDELATGLRDLQAAGDTRPEAVARPASWCPWPRPGVTVPGLWDELATTLTGVQGVDYRTLTIGAPSDETGLVLNVTASDVADYVQVTLRRLVRVCMALRVEHTAPAEWTPRDRKREVPAMAEWLSWRVDGIAWHAEAVEAAKEVRNAIDWVRWIVDRPATREQLGPCPVEVCPGILSAVKGATFAKCFRCGTAVEAQPLRDQALEQYRVARLTAAEIAKIATSLGRLSSDEDVPDGLANTSRDVVRNRINQWAHRGHIKPAAHAEDGTPRYRFGQVYDLLLEHERRHRHEFTDWRAAAEQPDPAMTVLVRSCTYEDCTETQTKTKRTTNSKGA